MRAVPTAIPDVVEIETKRFGDHRGHFAETFRSDWFAEHVSDAPLVQENQSFTAKQGTIRGLHAQTAPFGQGKLVTCVMGAVLDVAVDLRRGSKTFGKWVSIELSANKGNQIWIPPGFVHGFCTLSFGCLVSYKVTNYYSRENEVGVRWNDPDLGIDWPDIVDPELMAPRDQTWLPLSESKLSFDGA